jgi:hypothetical protein
LKLDYYSEARRSGPIRLRILVRIASALSLLVAVLSGVAILFSNATLFSYQPQGRRYAINSFDSSWIVIAGADDNFSSFRVSEWWTLASGLIVFVLCIILLRLLHRLAA